jgi:hypothetical protein
MKEARDTLSLLSVAFAGSIGLALHAQPVIDVPAGRIPMRILVQSPAETTQTFR